MKVFKIVLFVSMSVLWLTVMPVAAGEWTQNGADIVYPTGRVGIGTDTPGYKLDITGSERVTGSYVVSGHWQGLLFDPDTVVPGQEITGPRLTYNPNAKSLDIISGFKTEGTRLNFGIGTNVSWMTKMTIDPKGYVGIGTYTPGYRLDVAGAGRISGSLVVSGNWQGILFDPDTVAPGQEITGPRLTYNPTAKSLNIISGYTVEGNSIIFGIGNTTSWATKMIIDPAGNVGIGTTSLNHKLEVNGTVMAKRFLVDVDYFPDYVFDDDYDLLSLEEVEEFININGHLPNIMPEKAVVSSGMDVGELNLKLVEKVEELTLYMIELNKQVQELRNENDTLKSALREE